MNPANEQARQIERVMAIRKVSANKGEQTRIVS